MAASIRTVLVAGALALLVGCGGGGGDDASRDGGSDEGIDPIAEFLGYGADDFDEEEAQQQYLEEERERQALIAECMAGEGFTYVPVEPDQGFEVSSYPGEGLSPAEFAEEFGYGMSTMFEESFAEPIEDEFVDPNAATVEAMSETEREAWDTALYGSFEEDDALVVDAGEQTATSTAPDDGSFYGGGCEGEASEAVYGDQEEQFEEFEEFNSLFEDYNERLESDGRMVDARESWRDCMGERGYDFEEPDEAFEAVDERMQEIYEATDPTAGLTEEELVALSPEEVDALYAEAADIEPDPELLAEIQEFELAVAVADFECAAPIRDATEAIGQDFLDEHRAEFEQYRDLLEEQGVG